MVTFEKNYNTLDELIYKVYFNDEKRGYLEQNDDGAWVFWEYGLNGEEVDCEYEVDFNETVVELTQDLEDQYKEREH